MRNKVILYFLISCFLVILSNFNVQASDRQIVSSPEYVTSQVQCFSVAKSYNHYPYQEVPATLLQPVGNGQKLHEDAAREFAEMRLAAKKDGITLTPISGFRSVKQQEHLFYGVAKQRNQSLAQRAKVSAPPGYSQHHTGFAIDINSLNESFENTKAFGWLQINAERFGFELSFPRNNSQGIFYEPWHWAWHGSEEAKLALHDGCI
jgi:zinc D-Ala-D-Ala carboxypeptidase